MKTLRIDAVAILLYPLFKEGELLVLFGLQPDISPQKIVGSRPGIELDLIL